MILAILSVALMLDPGTPLRVALDEPLTVHRVGQPVTGTVIDDIYAYDRVVIPKGTKAIGHIARLEELSKRVRTFRLINGDFSPLHRVFIQFDALVFDDGRRMPFAATAPIGMPNLSRARAAEPEPTTKVGRAKKAAEQKVSESVHAITDRGRMERLRTYLIDSLPYHREHLPRGTVYAAELIEPLRFGTTSADDRAAADAKPAPGSILYARLVSTLSSAATTRGEALHAVLTEPVKTSDGKLLMPVGTQFDGEVTFAKPARRLHRNGQLRFLIQSVHVPGEEQAPMLASLAATDVDQSAAIDEEGGIKATESKARFAAPAIAAVIARGTMAEDGIEGPELGGGPALPGANVLGRGAGGFIGLGVFGIGLSQLGKAPAVALGMYGLGRSVYSTVFGRGRDIVMPAGTSIQLQLSPAAGASPPPGGSGQ